MRLNFAHLWSNPATRRSLLERLTEKRLSVLTFCHELQSLIEADNSDLFDVLAYVAYLLTPMTRAERALHAKVIVDSTVQRCAVSLPGLRHEPLRECGGGGVIPRTSWFRY